VFEAQTHQDGCSSALTSKTIYVVPFNPALFSISPEKDTIEIGGDGVQLTLNYDGVEYPGEYMLNTYDPVYITETGNIVKAVDQTGTFEVFAEVGGLKVATALITVNEQLIEYTVANVSVCEGTDEAEVVIYASGSIYGKTVTVRDEDGNTLYPEYNDNNDAATLHLNYLSTGTYTFTVYQDDVYKTEFTVTVNSLPRAYIECPIDPVVGDTWTPNTAMAEGLTYHWWSDNISSLDGSMSCCPQVTFTEAGDFSATLVVKNNETGCLSEGATCEFTVGEKAQEYFLNCPDGDLSLGESYYVMFLNAGDATGKTLTWSTSDEEIVSLAPDSDNGQCVVNFKQVGTAQIYCQVAEPTGEVLEMVACTLNIVQPKAVYFSQGTFEVENGTPTTICLTAEGLDLTNAQITYEVSNDKILSVEPSAAATGCAVLTSGVTTTETLSIVATIVVGEETYEATADVHVVEPFVCEGQKIVGGTYIDLEENNFVDGDNYRFKMIGTSNFDGNIIVHIREYVFTEETQSVIISSQVAHEVYKGQEFSFYDLLEISNVVEAGNRAFKLYISPMPTECPTGYDEFGSPVCYGELCQTYYALAKEEKQECATIAFDYSKENQNFTLMRQGVTSSAVAGDTFTVAWEGTANFTGYINVALIDQSAEAGYWAEVSEWDSFEVEAGVPFYFTKPYVVTEAVSSAPEIGLFATIDEQVDDASVCETYFVVTKQESNECTTYTSGMYVQDYGNERAEGDEFNLIFEGTSYFDGIISIMLANVNESSSAATPASNIVEVNVEAGKEFHISEKLMITNLDETEGVKYYFIATFGENSNNEVCVSKMEMNKIQQWDIKEYTLSPSELTMMVGNYEHINVLGDGELFYGDVEWNVTDLSGSTTPCVIVDY
ncbi:MAG: hypothetical protein J6V74_08025, partial [Bacteroidales bacterium]|nr:hypothetical protein [Bacteroidales bacterium]